MSQTIFVLEDDADISRLVQYHLESAGFIVRPYLTVGQILSDAERQPPALFLLDIMVPGGDGLDVCRRLRSNPTLSTIPIIFLTASKQSGLRQKAQQLGAAFFEKPYDADDLLAAIRYALLERSGRRVRGLRDATVSALS